MRLREFSDKIPKPMVPIVTADSMVHYEYYRTLVIGFYFVLGVSWRHDQKYFSITMSTCPTILFTPRGNKLNLLNKDMMTGLLRLRILGSTQARRKTFGS